MPKKHKNLKFILIFLFIFTALLFFFLCFLFVPFRKKIYPNIYVAGIYVGDKTKDEALQILKNKVNLPEEIVLEIADDKNYIKTAEIVQEINYKNTIDRAYYFANGGNYPQDIKTKLNLILNPKNINLEIKYNDQKINEFFEILTNKYGKSPKQPSIKIAGKNIYVDSGGNGTKIDIESAKFRINKNLSLLTNSPVKISLIEDQNKLSELQTRNYEERGKNFIGKKIIAVFEENNIEIETDKLVQFIDPITGGYKESEIKKESLHLSKIINKNPQNSVFIVEDNVVKEFVPSKDGLVVQEDALNDKFIESLSVLEKNNQQSVSFVIPVIKTEPKIKTEDVNNLGIKTLLGKGGSKFKGSIANRIHNINHASNKFKSILVPANETFSFNEILGDVSTLTGYKAAYVIKNGKTVLGDGGGVCQVSTTLFRAVLNAGLPIIERHPHSYRVSYYEQGSPPGFDATIFYPTTDFKFKNDTPNYILIQAMVDNANYSLSFEIYGTHDNRIVELSKPKISPAIAPPPDLYIDDPALPAGEIKQIEHKAYGAKVSFDYKVTKNERVLTEQTFVSNYRPWQAVYLRGVAQ